MSRQEVSNSALERSSLICLILSRLIAAVSTLAFIVLVGQNRSSCGDLGGGSVHCTGTTHPIAWIGWVVLGTGWLLAFILALVSKIAQTLDDHALALDFLLGKDVVVAAPDDQ